MLAWGWATDVLPPPKCNGMITKKMADRMADKPPLCARTQKVGAPELSLRCRHFLYGAAYRTRTDDLLFTRQLTYHGGRPQTGAIPPNHAL